MRIAQISLGFGDFPEPDKWSVNVFVTGCTHFCKGCQNPQLADFNNGIEYSPEELADAIKNECKRNSTECITFLGGDPCNVRNVQALIEVCSYLRGYKICVYTGNEIDNIPPILYEFIEYLKTGVYIQTPNRIPAKTDEKLVLASKNQRFYQIINKKPALISKRGIIDFRCRSKLWRGFQKNSIMTPTRM